MAKKGGYFLLDFGGLNLDTTGETSVKIDGIYDQIEGNHGKRFVLANLVFDNVEKNEVGAEAVLDNDYFIFTVYNHKIIVGDDDEIVIGSALVENIPEATTFANLGAATTAYNALLNALKDGGIMTPDAT